MYYFGDIKGTERRKGSREPSGRAEWQSQIAADSSYSSTYVPRNANEAYDTLYEAIQLYNNLFLYIFYIDSTYHITYFNGI